MKLIFLDMDGVMNSVQSSHYYWKRGGRKTFLHGFDHICPIAASNLDWLLERVPDARIVISSTWRLHFELKDWDEMVSICPAIAGRVIGMTPSLRHRLSESPQRGHETHKWLDDNGKLETPYIVFDDGHDMDKVEKNFIWVDADLGLTVKNIMEVFIRWGVSPND